MDIEEKGNMNKRNNKSGAMDFHVLPPKGLLNDPNGLVHYKGTTHIFFQWNPHDTDHSYKCWGHATTEDLIHYTYHEAALLPEEWYEKNGCYSGSGLVHEDRLYLFYTGNVKNEKEERESYQCVAVSEDGFHFEKLGPVIRDIEGYTAHVRDPKVFRHEDGLFYMVLGAQREDLTGDTIIFRSEDLLKWDFMGSLMDEKVDLGYMWECPDLINHKDKSIFIFSPQGLEPEGEKYRNIFQTGYYTGTFQNGIFRKDDHDFTEMDRGFEYYAPQSFDYPDGRILSMGWMGTVEKEKEEALPTVKEGWVHHLSILRELSLSSDGRLLQKPVRELESAREKVLEEKRDSLRVEIETPFEVNLKVSDKMIRLELRYGGDLKLIFDGSAFRVERRDWLTGEREYRSVELKEGLTELQMLVDHTSAEIFINGGREVFSLRFFKEEENHELLITGNEDMNIELYRLVI